MRIVARTMVGVLLVGLGGCTGSASRPDGGGSDGGAAPVVVMTTSLGDLVVRLEAAAMPVTTGNFLAYVDSGFYDGTLIHRVVDDWVIQGGGFTSGLTAKTPRPPIALETNALVRHVHGAISMARTTDRNSASSQWFICDWPTTGTAPHPMQLDGQYAAFGVLIEGLDVLEAITKVGTTTVGALMGVPAQEIVVTSARRR